MADHPPEEHHHDETPSSSGSTLGGDGRVRPQDTAEQQTIFAPIRTATAAPTARSLSHKETRDPSLDIELPYRTISAGADLSEYYVEVPSGQLDGPPEPEALVRKITTQGGEAAPGSPGGPGAEERRYKLVTFTPNDPDNPKNWSKARKWWCTMVVAVTCFVVAFASAVITADLAGVAREFNVSLEVSFLTITVFVVGFGVGPMVFAPLSEIYGRRII
jgi:hypothetical protein